MKIQEGKNIPFDQQLNLEDHDKRFQHQEVLRPVVQAVLFCEFHELALWGLCKKTDILTKSVGIERVLRMLFAIDDGLWNHKIVGVF